MRVAKLSVDKIVMCLSDPSPVKFADGLWVLVTDRLTDNPRRWNPYWVPSTSVVRVIEF